MKFSIVIPLYNKADFICETLQSVLDQTVVPHELIIVDDNSTDGSLDIARKFLDNIGHKYQALKTEIIQLKENKGVSYARNMGFSKTTGDILCFLDADDLYEPKLLETAQSLMLDKEIEFILIGFNFFPNGDHYPNIDKIQSDLVPLTQDAYLLKKPFHTLTSKHVVMGVGSNVITKREWMKAVKYNEDARFYQGVDYWYEVLKVVVGQKPTKIAILMGNYLKVRIVPGSNSRQIYQRWDEIALPPTLTRLKQSHDVYDVRLRQLIADRWLRHSIQRLTSYRHKLIFIYQYRNLLFQHLGYKYFSNKSPRSV